MNKRYYLQCKDYTLYDRDECVELSLYLPLDVDVKSENYSIPNIENTKDTIIQAFKALDLPIEVEDPNANPYGGRYGRGGNNNDKHSKKFAEVITPAPMWASVMSFSHNVAYSDNAGAGQQQVHIGEFSATRFVDDLSPVLNYFCLKNEPIPNVILRTQLKINKKDMKMSVTEYECTSAFITNQSVSGGSGGKPVETLSLKPIDLVYKVYEFNLENGDVIKKTISKWNSETSTGSRTILSGAKSLVEITKSRMLAENDQAGIKMLKDMGILSEYEVPSPNKEVSYQFLFKSNPYIVKQFTPTTVTRVGVIEGIAAKLDKPVSDIKAIYSAGMEIETEAEFQSSGLVQTTSPFTVELIDGSFIKVLIMVNQNIVRMTQSLRTVFLAQKTRPLEWRYSQLKAMKKMITENKDDIIKSVHKDLGKHVFEITQSEVVLIVAEIEETISKLEGWVKPEKVYTPVGMKPATSHIVKDPLGVVLIISPWNYPVNLALVPLIGAIAAGNCAHVKLSRHSASTGELLHRLLTQYMDKEAFTFDWEGGAQYITDLIEVKWDHIFFTGSVNVGRIVYQAAAKFLTPVTLELGGKNPCIVDKEANLKLAATKIVWGKCWNAGQTCIGLDYLLVHKSVVDDLIEEFKVVLKDFYGENIKESPSFARVVSKQHTERLQKLFSCGKVVIGGEADVEQRYVAPTFIVEPDLESPIMTEEIFGPVLPIITYENIDEVISFIQARPHPLTLYLFSTDSAVQDKILENTQSGSVMYNEVLLHFANNSLPFGGVGDSGLGSYHGKGTFDTFVHRRALVKGTTKKWLDVSIKYPPYSELATNVVGKLMGSGW
ncbi:aldehyde dehydrogenase [Cavenderia fasciculata]|uniref:Aldehyde dehydrogenase n=1 Tax=Cavenderia fasciculata TaxID=261658 RepID=F4Q764_CACFS|nr:aldehyde dehydrogenase [Cavenderia fasciculata]EGG16246.1 aldehyde dehydrogenase [Cavenderia fasciculata]|eukprot:XP_004354630.1 aldehyde dehydrogenase [Cavenderia fasciculata]